MNCNEVKSVLSQYYDSEISPGDREQVAAHLAACADCSAELARFGQLSQLVQQLPAPEPSRTGWTRLQHELRDVPTVSAADQDHAKWIHRRRSRAVLAVAATMLVALGWFSFNTWFASDRNLLAANIERYVTQFHDDPRAAQQELVAKYDGQSIDPNDAVQYVSYRPAVADGMPADYELEGMYLLRLPCCDCVHTVCRREDGSRFAIFEYAEESPLSVNARHGGMEHCRGNDCCLAKLNQNFAASWQKDDHQISIVGIRSAADIDQLAAWLK